MSFEEEVYQWNEELAKHFLGLSKPQRENVARFGLAVIKARDCRMSIMAEQVAELGKEESAERQLQRTVSNKHIEMGRCQRDWARWALSKVEGRLYLLVDETKLGANLSVMMVGVAYRKRCVPLVWRCYKAGAYPAEGQVGLIEQLLKVVAEVLPMAAEPPIVQADRGIGTSPDLVRVVEQLGWRYLFRVQNTTRVCLPTTGQTPIGSLVTPGQRFSTAGQVFKGDGFLIQGWLHVIWDKRYDEPWSLITNDPTLSGDEYACRAWQETSFRDLKSGGWKWNNSRVWQPDHADRLLLILALAYSFILSLGTLVLDAPLALRKRLARGSRSRFGIFRLGLRLLKFAWRSCFSCPLALDFVHPPPLLSPPSIL
jgi:Transposase DDE domain